MNFEIIYKGIGAYIISLIVLISAVAYILIAIGTLVTVVAVVFTLYIIIPIIFKYTPSLQKGLLFFSSAYVPVDFKQPQKLIPGSRNFFINSKNENNEDVKLGVWQILPRNLLLNATVIHPLEQFDKWLSHGEPVFIYMHGNAGNRGSRHRVDLYKVLQANNYHVIAFDYRNYGDSDKSELSEVATVTDSEAVYAWTMEKVKGKAPIFFWGHSLGTGISSHLLYDLEKKNRTVSGLILESPFNNLGDEIKSYPLAQLWSFLPWFDHFFTEPMSETGLRYTSDEYLQHVKAPILILHAQDDPVIPIRLSKKLYDVIVSSRGQALIEYVTFPADRRYGHTFIVKDKELPSILSKFVQNSVKHAQSSLRTPSTSRSDADVKRSAEER